MEYKLNKIDTDIRKKMQEEIKTSKVHSSQNINVNKDTTEEKEMNHDGSNQPAQREKRFITIDGVKYTDKPIKIKAERTEKINVLNSSGRILDTKK